MDQDEHVQNIYKRNFLGMVSEEIARFLCFVVVLLLCIHRIHDWEYNTA